MRTVPVAMRSLLLLLKLCTSSTQSWDATGRVLYFCFSSRALFFWATKTSSPKNKWFIRLVFSCLTSFWLFFSILFFYFLFLCCFWVVNRTKTNLRDLAGPADFLSWEGDEMGG